MTFRTLTIRGLAIRSLTLCAALMLAHAGVASAQTVKLEFLNGHVNLSAQNAPIRVILAEWARLGGTRIVNADRITGAPVTLELKNVPERKALDTVLRDVPGYMITARQTASAAASHFDRIMVLPVATQTRPTSNVAAFTPPLPRPVPEDDPDIDDVEDITALRRADQEALRRAEELARQRALEQAGRVVGQPVIGDGGAPTIRQATPFLPAPQPQPVPQAAPPPVPGQVTRPSTNPFITTLPGSARPGEITPVPQQENRPPGVPNEAER